MLRVNHAQIGLVLTPGAHEVVLEHRPAGFLPGLGLTLATLALLALGVVRARRHAQRTES